MQKQAQNHQIYLDVILSAALSYAKIIISDNSSNDLT